jgi:hypothetical protein
MPAGMPFLNPEIAHPPGEGMARTNYSFAKRQKEIERKKKQEEKRSRRQGKGKTDSDAPEGQDPGDPQAPAGPTDEAPTQP